MIRYLPREGNVPGYVKGLLFRATANFAGRAGNDAWWVKEDCIAFCALR